MSSREYILIDKPYSVYKFERLLANNDLSINNEEMTYFLDNMLSILINNIDSYKIEEIVKGLEVINADIYEFLIQDVNNIQVIYSIIDELMVDFFNRNLISRSLTITNVLEDKIILTKG